MKPSFCGKGPSTSDVRPPCVSDEEVDRGSEYSGPELAPSTASESEKSDYGQRAFIDSSSSEEESAIPPKVDARVDPAVQKAMRSRRQRRKRSSILQRRVRFDLESPEDPINHCAEVEDDNVEDADDQRELAKKAYEVYNHFQPGSATHDQVAASKKGVQGWLDLSKLFNSEFLAPNV